MRVLWITNITFPEALRSISYENELKSSGGWMIGAAEALLKLDNIFLSIISVSDKVKKLTKIQGKNILYYVVPMGNGNVNINPEYESYFKAIEANVKPDVIHIHGTEYSHGLAYINTCGSKNVVISIQGLTSVYYKYYNSGISVLDIFSNLTIRDVLHGSILSEKRSFKRRGKYENQMIKSVSHVIGRTSWDKAHVWAINPYINYHFCNETLRQEFYDSNTWSYNNCDKHSIFLSQATYPIKGLHQLLKALPIVLSHYPDTHIRIAGTNILNTSPLSFIYQPGYSRYVTNLIKKNKLKDKISFVGKLDVNKMIEEYLRANVFICPSSIENSPNSLGEAQMLGVPCIASYVGGVCDMMQGCEENMYRFEEVEMLAYKICDIFSKEDKINDMRCIAKERHNPMINAKQLYSIYLSILNS